MDDIVHSLTRLGFSRNEASVYLACLKTGKARAVEVAKLAKVNRATTYSVLESLAQKGLVTPLSDSGERWYLPEPPERIAALLHLQQQEIESRRRMADQLMLRLKVFHNVAAHKPKIRYVESVDGLRNMQREYEGRGEDIIQMVAYDTFCAICPRSRVESHRDELARGTGRVRSILITDQDLGDQDELGDEFVCISPSLMDVQGEMSVCGDRLLLFSYQSGIIAIEIHSKTIADTARATLELAWKEAQRWAKNGKGDWALGEASLKSMTNPLPEDKSDRPQKEVSDDNKTINT